MADIKEKIEKLNTESAAIPGDFPLPLRIEQCFNSSTMNIENLTSTQLRQAADLIEKIAGLQTQLAAFGGSGSGMPSPFKTGKRGPKKGKMSASAKAKIAAAQKARWAKFHAKAKPAKTEKPAKKKGKMSAAGRARIAAAQRLRWAKINAGKTKPAPKPAKRKKMSASARAKLAAAARARWAKVKAAGKTSL